MNPLPAPKLAKVMLPPLLMLIAVALPKPATAEFVPKVMMTGWAIFIAPVNAWSPLIVTALVPVLLKLMVPAPAAKLVKVCAAELYQFNVAPDATLKACA